MAVKDADPLELAWLAGLTDGDGSIGFTSRTGGKSKEYWRPFLRIGMTHALTIQHVIDICGYGKLRTYSGVRRKPFFFVHASWRMAEEIIRAIEPYLVTKREQARLILCACDAKRAGKVGGKITTETNMRLVELSESARRHNCKPGNRGNTGGAIRAS